MPANETLYRVGLSGVGGSLIGGLGAVVGLSWAAAIDAGPWLIAAVAALTTCWGVLVVNLTPTGGTITENRTTVNYAVFALHAWYALFLCVPAMLILALRTWAF